MSGQTNVDALQPLLDYLRAEDDPALSVAALSAAAEFPLDADGWYAVLAATAPLLDELPFGTPERRALVHVAATIPLMSVRRRLREVAASPGDPDAADAADALAAVADASQAEALAGRVAAGEIERLAELAAMPLELTALSPEDIPPAPEYADPTLALWRAIALARLGRCEEIDLYLAGAVEPPPLFWADPGLAYAALAAVRPLPEPLAARLLAALPGTDRIAEHDRASMARQIIRACTGVADAEGAPVAEGLIAEEPVAERPAGPVGMSAPAEDAGPALPAAVAAERVLDTLADADALHRGSPPEALEALAGLSPAATDAFVVDLVERACRFAYAQATLEPHAVALGNAVVGAVAGLRPTSTWPVERLAELYLRADPAPLDCGQMAWIVARAPAATAVAGIVAEAASLEDPAARRRLLELIGEVGATLAGRSPSPWRGAGGAGAGRPRRPELIDDEPQAAMRGGPPTPPEPDFTDDPFEAGYGAGGPSMLPPEPPLSAGPPEGPKMAGAGEPEELEETAAAAGEGEETAAATSEEAAPAEGRDARRVHTRILHGGERRNTFVAGADHVIRCWIGLPEPERAEAADRPIPHVDHIPEEGLALDVQLEWKGQRPIGRIVLPASRTARTADCDLSIHVPEGERYVSATLTFLFRRRVFEMLQIEAFVLRPGEPELPHHEVLRLVQIDQRQVIELEDRAPVDAAFVYGEEPATDADDGETTRTLLEFGAQGAARYSLAKTATAVAWLNKELFVADKNLVRARERARGPGSEPEPVLDDEDETTLTMLRHLAQHGAEFYNQLTGQHFRDPGPRIQLLNRTPDEYMPLEFVYDRGFPADDARLCDGWREALGGDDDECPCCGPAADLDEAALDNAPTLCPLGFWSLRKIIERLDPFGSGPGAEDRSVPRTGRRALAPIDRALFGASHNVLETDRTETLDALRQIVGDVRLADDWDAWRDAVGAGPVPLLVALPHHGIKDAQDYLELGGDQTPEPARILKRGRLRHLYVNPDRHDPGPIVLLIGCETAAEGATGYPALARRFQQLHASIVVGTLAKVLGRHAAPVARELVRQLATVDDPEADFATLMRRVRRRMLLRGYLMSMCLVALGDGDWRVAAPRAAPAAAADQP